MEPTIGAGDLFVARLHPYATARPKRGDIVVFKRLDESYGGDPGNANIKRIAGLPGERIAIRDFQVYIDGESLEETYIQHPSGRTG